MSESRSTTMRIIDEADALTEKILEMYRKGYGLDTRAMFGSEANQTLKRLRRDLDHLREFGAELGQTVEMNVRLAEQSLNDLEQAIYEKALDMPPDQCPKQVKHGRSPSLGYQYRDGKQQVSRIPSAEYQCRDDHPCYPVASGDIQRPAFHSYDCWYGNVERIETIRSLDAWETLDKLTTEGPSTTNTESEIIMNISTTYAKTKAGTVGQILHKDTIVWESGPQEDEKDDEGRVVRTATTVALDVANEHVDEVVAELFA